MLSWTNRWEGNYYGWKGKKGKNKGRTVIYLEWRNEGGKKKEIVTEKSEEESHLPTFLREEPHVAHLKQSACRLLFFTRTNTPLKHTQSCA